MTQTSTAAAPFTIADKDAETSWIDLITWAKGELTALEAGMIGQTDEARRLQNRMWNAQYEALGTIVRVALAAGTDADAIMEITHA